VENLEVPGFEPLPRDLLALDSIVAHHRKEEIKPELMAQKNGVLHMASFLVRDIQRFFLAKLSRFLKF
jgi:hypothetical protein